MYQKMKGKYGITLVSLVITVIVLLILAGVSLTMLTNENGIISKAQEAKEETRGATVEEAKDIWKLNKELYESTSSSNVQTLEELLAELESKEQLTAEEVETIKETGEVTIGSRTIEFSKGTVKLDACVRYDYGNYTYSIMIGLKNFKTLEMYIMEMTQEEKEQAVIDNCNIIRRNNI